MNIGQTRRKAATQNLGSNSIGLWLPGRLDHWIEQLCYSIQWCNWWRWRVQTSHFFHV